MKRFYSLAISLSLTADLLVVKLDVTNPADAESAVQAAVDRFGRIDVLVNNAASFYAGFFEELPPEQINQQLQTSLIGPMHVTRAVLPVMRRQRSGHIISISSTAGLTSFDFCSAHSASKFGLEGWMLALQSEVEPFGIYTTIVNPGFFLTELLTEESTNYADHPPVPSIHLKMPVKEKVIDMAKERIFDQSKSVSQIACELGFKYPQHFTRLFKQRVGQSPNEYRMHHGD
jgi:NAD(P)-dependent dehydrogenase (short-subunit alcohol dehydrogenase family)